MTESIEQANRSLAKWKSSAEAWITDQGKHGDWSRQQILDPALEDVFASVDGKRVLDLGCGEGRYSRVLKSRGAHVTGIDPVPRFIERAKELDNDSTYVTAFAEELPLEDDCFDVVLSYLTLVDIPDLEKASQEICRVIKSGGQLVIVNISNMASTTEGWVKDANGKKLYRIVDRYMEHFAMDLQWRGIDICNYHRPLSFLLGLFLDCGFLLDKFIEPLPEPTDKNYQEEFRAPNFQIYSLRYLPELA